MSESDSGNNGSNGVIAVPKTGGLALRSLPLARRGLRQLNRFIDSRKERLRIKLNGKYGYIDVTGKFVVDPVFDLGWDFSEGAAVVVRKGKYGCIDENGSWLIEPRFDWLGSFQDGLALAVKTGTSDFDPEHYPDPMSRVGGLWGYVDKSGSWAIAPIYDEKALRWGGFSEGLCPVKVTGKWGYIDKMGYFVVDPIYDGASFFTEGLAQVKVEKLRGFINPTGEMVIPPQWDASASLFTDGHSIVSTWKQPRNKDAPRNLGLIDRSGKYIIPMEQDELGYFGDDLASFIKNTGRPDALRGYYDVSGNVSFALDFDSINHHGCFSEGMASVCRVTNGQDLFGFIDTNGSWAIEPRYGWAGEFSEGIACAELNGKHGFIDCGGDIVIDAEFDDRESYIDTVTDLCGIPDFFDFDDFNVCKNGNIRVCKDVKVGYLTKQGDYIWPLTS